jgi:hypothetical protein
LVSLSQELPVVCHCAQLIDYSHSIEDT